jgi:hypothetical protein
LVLLALAVIAVGAATACADSGQDGDDHSGSVADNAAQDEDASIGSDGSDTSSAQTDLDQRVSTDGAERDDRNVVSLIGALKGDPSEFNQGVFGDVAGHKNLAFVGKWHEGCPGTGVDIIDISRPSAPVKLSDTNDYPDTSMEDMQAMEVGGRDVLAIGLQDCRNDPTPGAGRSGLELYDITDPGNPRFLSLFNTDEFAADSGGVHELDITTTPSGDVLVLGAVPDLETRSSGGDGKNGTGDLLIWNINDPVNPILIGEWGVLDEPSLGRDFYLDVRKGGDARTLLHSPRSNEEGTRAYLSYWDVGVITLDISDPLNPVYLGRTTFAEGEEGNAHSVDEARSGNVLIQADEDLTPFHFELASNAFPDEYLVVQAAFTPSVIGLTDREMDGEVVHVGRGCPAGSIAAAEPTDPYLADPSGKIALIEGGGCRLDDKIVRAQLAGATGAIVYSSTEEGEDLVPMDDGSVPLLDGTVTDLDIPTVLVRRNTGLLLRDSPPPIMASTVAVFNGWGYLRFFDMEDPANPKQLSTFATENTNNEAVASGGTWRSVHNPEVWGDTLYASWFGDGVRVIDISDPSSPRELGSWSGEGASPDAPPVDIWSAVPHGDLLLVSDRNYGLYILRHTS